MDESPCTEALRIRRARASDAETLSLLAFRAKAYWGYSAAFMAACREELTVSPADLSSETNEYRLAEAGRRTQGFYGIAALTGDGFELEALFIDTGAMGRGLGRRLFQHAVGVAGELGGRYLLIQSDPHAQPFYLAMGARPFGERPSGSIPGRSLPLLRYLIVPDA